MLRAHRHLSRAVVAVAGLALVGGGVATTNIALADHGTVSLSGSSFEIDSDANLKADHGAPWVDWSTVPAVSKADTPSGGGDESFGNGTKEDTASPSVVSGGIPPNKSDLKHFGVHQEGAGGSGFLTMYWSRVQEPTGTTNMDFEFNARQCTPKQTPADTDCTANGLTPKRTAGDLLITYDLSQGGTNPNLSLREWSGSSWGGALNLTSSAKARGSINSSSIAAAEASGLGAHTPRTFGEAQIDLSAVFEENICESFGSVYLKSRSSDSFTAALKDFVPPAAVNISNCGSVKIIKHSASEDGPRLNGASFKLYENEAPLAGPLGPEDSATTFECTTASTPTEDGTCTMTNVPLGEYWLREEAPPTGYTEDSVDQRVTLTGSSVVEKHFVNQVASVTSTMSTEQRWLPNDKATIAIPNDIWGDLAGTFRFELYESDDCTGAIKYTEDVSANSARDIDNGPDGGLSSTVLTANTGFYTTARTISWKVSYDPGGTRPNQVGQSGVCDVMTVSTLVNH